MENRLLQKTTVKRKRNNQQKETYTNTKRCLFKQTTHVNRHLGRIKCLEKHGIQDIAVNNNKGDMNINQKEA